MIICDMMFIAGLLCMALNQLVEDTLWLYDILLSLSIILVITAFILLLFSFVKNKISVLEHVVNDRVSLFGLLAVSVIGIVIALFKSEGIGLWIFFAFLSVTGLILPSTNFDYQSKK